MASHKIQEYQKLPISINGIYFNVFYRPIENNGNSIFFSVLPKDFGSQIHVIAAAFFTIMILFRFYYANPRKKKMIDNHRDDLG
jgi:hypothetical protein